MQSGRNFKRLSLLFLVILAVYLMAFYGIEHLRHRKGPWEVTFVADASGHPALVINQSFLSITSVTIRFLNETAPVSNVSSTVVFDQPGQALPFGHVLFEDLTFLPGAVALNLFGHEIELLPRILALNREEVPWRDHQVIELPSTNHGNERRAMPP